MSPIIHFAEFRCFVDAVELQIRLILIRRLPLLRLESRTDEDYSRSCCGFHVRIRRGADSVESAWMEEMIDTRTIDRNSLYPRLTNIYVEFKLMIENNDVLTLIEKLY